MTLSQNEQFQDISLSKDVYHFLHGHSKNTWGGLITEDYALTKDSLFQNLDFERR